MKTRDTKETLFYLCVWLAMLAQPRAARSEFNYVTNSGKITIIKYTGPGGAVAIPETIDGLPVIAVADKAFFSTAKLTSVAIPESVTSVGNSVFANCRLLIEVTLPNSITHIGSGAFSNCVSLTTMKLPNRLTSVEPYTFYRCASLSSITIPGNIVNVGSFAFASAAGLTNVTLVGGVASIEDHAFEGTRLLSAIIPNSVTNIGTFAFSSCLSLNNASISGSVARIGNQAFDHCTSLKEIVVAASNPAYCSVAGVLFSKSQTALIQFPGGKAGEYTIPEAVTNIGRFAFNYCTNLTRVSIGNSVSEIGEAAFAFEA